MRQVGEEAQPRECVDVVLGRCFHQFQCTVMPSPGSGSGQRVRLGDDRVPRGGDSFFQVSIVSTRFARRHVPTISPSTSSAPGQTRGVQSSFRCFLFGTSSARSWAVVCSQ